MANIDPKKAEGLLNAVSKKLNIPPETLKKQLEEGKFDAALGSMGKSQSQKFNMILNNPQLWRNLFPLPRRRLCIKK